MRRADVVPVSQPHVGSVMLVGPSAAARRLADDIRAAADASCVLLEAERGLEAVEIARAIHEGRPRVGPFRTVECGATEPALVERELFGVVLRRGAGELETITPSCAVALAGGGTLYVEDVSELSAAAQARLARVARDGEVRVSGEPCRVDVCLVASTSTDPDTDVEEGRLRRDLFRYFSRTRIVVPPLRRRPDDIPAMVDAIVAELCSTARMLPKSLTQAALTLLSAMPWRGNLVELRVALSHLVSDIATDTIQLEDVLAHVRFDGAPAPHAPAGTLRSARQQFERDYIALMLQHHRGRVGDAARALGIQRTNLYRKARQLGISVARPVQDY